MTDTNTYSDQLIDLIANKVMIRSGDLRIFRLVRVSNGMELAHFNDYAAAAARAKEMVRSGRF